MGDEDGMSELLLHDLWETHARLTPKSKRVVLIVVNPADLEGIKAISSKFVPAEIYCGCPNLIGGIDVLERLEIERGEGRMYKTWFSALVDLHDILPIKTLSYIASKGLAAGEGNFSWGFQKQGENDG